MRNKARFEGKRTWVMIDINHILSSIHLVLCNVKVMYDRREDFSALYNLGITLSLRKSSISIIYWSPPLGNNLKLNTDGASRGNLDTVGGGGVIRNSSGRMICAFFFPYGCITSFTAEFLSLLDGLRLCCSRKLIVNIIELDSMALLHLITNRKKPPWRLLSFCSELWELLDIFKPKISHIYREGNQVADVLSNVACDSGSFQFFDDVG